MSNSVVCAIFLLCLLPITVIAGVEEFHNSLDVTLYKLASENNDASAQYLIARKYLRGKSVTKNSKAAIKWLKLAANQGHSKAQFQLGLIHLKGIGVKPDNSLAKAYFLKAAKNGLDDAQFQLGQFYRRGFGGAKNRYQAVKWYKKSISQDNILAQFILGKMYFEGDGVSRDYVKAVSWLRKAAGSGDFQAAKLLSTFEKDKPEVYREALRLASNAAKKKVNKNLDNNRSKTKKSAKKAKRDSKKLTPEELLQLGMNYLHGEHGYKVNVVKGIRLIKRAAKKGHSVAQFDYGVLLSQGGFVDVDIEKAVYWLTKAVNGGVERAKPLLTELQLELMLSDKIKNASTADEQYQLATQYLLGNVIDKNIGQAFQWYLKAARQKHLKSQYQVGAMYHTGAGVAQNSKKAKFWLSKAAQRGIAEADNLLSEIDTKNDRIASIDKQKFDAEEEQLNLNVIIEENPRDKEPREPEVEKQAQFLEARESDKSDPVVASLTPRANKNSKRSVQNMDITASPSSHMNVILSQARKGDSQSQFVVAKNYLAGVNIDQDIEKGLEWLTLSANNNHISAQLQLGAMFLFGDNVSIDFSRAYRWIKLAAESGDNTAQLYLGDMYKKGQGIKRSNSKAIKWYRISANHGNAIARKRLGGCRVC